jgi:uncharacterized protein YbjT (DUF2867 family)
MKITVTGSLGNISRILVGKLVSKGHEVQVITSSGERRKEIEELKARPLVGSVEDFGFMKGSFQGSDAVYLMIPPGYHAGDVKQYIKTVGGQYAKAVREARVKYVVNLSSIGAHVPDGLGPTGANYYVEQQLNALENTHVLHLRPGMFLSNFYGAIGMMKHQNMLGNNFDGIVNVPLTHPRDIANAAFNALDTLSFSGKQVQYIVSDVKSGVEIAKTLGTAIGKPDLNWVAFSDEQLLGALVQSGLPEAAARVYMIEIGAALRNGSFMENYHKHKQAPMTGTSLQEFSKEFAMAYQNSY